MYSNGKRQIFPAGQVNTDEDGTYKISNIAPGRYYLSAIPPRMNSFEGTRKADPIDPTKPEEDLITTYYPGVTDISSANTIEVVAGRDMPGTDVRLQKSQVFRIKGKIAGSLPADAGSRVRVMVMRRDSFMMNFGGPGSAMINKDGTFELHGVAPGSYNLIATTTQGMMKTLARQSIEVGNRNIDDITFIAQPPGTLRGSVQLEKAATTDSSQPPPDLSRVRINLSATTGMSFGMPQGTVKADGTFSFEDIAADKYRINVFGNADGSYLKSARVGNQDALAGDLDFTGGVGAATLDIVLGPGGGQISGIVQDDHQQPATGTQVYLLPDPMDTNRTYLHKFSMTDQNGGYNLRGIAPGKYRLYAWEDMENGSQYDPDVMKPLESLGTKITVDENGHHTQVLTRISVAQAEQAKTK
jgi:protocatechuate 3,4-dioxygenase beta subunit